MTSPTILPESATARSWLRRLEGAVLLIGAAALLLLALLQVGVVAARLVDAVVPASSELALVLVIAGVSSALLLATLHAAHPHITALVDRLPPPLARCAQMLVLVLSCGYWFALGGVATRLAVDYGAVGERTEILALSIIPLRWLFASALLASGALLLLRLYVLLRQARS